jgi:hypothetical protein
MKVNLHGMNSLLIFTTILVVIVFVLKEILLLSFVHEYAWYMIPFFFLQSLFIGIMTKKAMASKPQDFGLFYFGAMTARLFISIIVAVVVILTFETNKVYFAGNFFVFYFSYIMFEIYSVLSNLRAHSKGQN